MLLVEFPEKNCRMGIAPIDHDSETLIAHLDRKELYLPFIENMAEHRRREWLTVRLLAKQLLGEEKEIAYMPNGKPFFADRSFHISISHTKGHVALLLAPDSEVAIDIEHISPRIYKVRSRFLSAEEDLAIDKDNELIHLLLHWSAKECMFKYLNCESVDFQTQLHIAPFVPCIGQWGNFTTHETRTTQRNTFTINYFVAENYVVTTIFPCPFLHTAPSCRT